MEIQCTGSYPFFLIDVRRLPILVFILPLFLFDKDVWFIGFVFLAYLIFAQINYKFTTSVRLEGSQLIIQYKRFFINWEKTLALKGMVMDMIDYKDIVMRTVNKNGGTNYLLTILINGDRKFRIDTRVGFTKEDFLELMKAVGRAPVQ